MRYVKGGERKKKERKATNKQSATEREGAF
jgi:hypothetical protein